MSAQGYGDIVRRRFKRLFDDAEKAKNGDV